MPAAFIIEEKRYHVVQSEPVPPPPPSRTEVKVAVLDSGAGGAYTVSAVTARILPGYTLYGTPGPSSQASSGHQAYITGRVLNSSDGYVKVGNLNIADQNGVMYTALVDEAIAYCITNGYRVATLSIAGGPNVTIVKTAATTFEAAGGVLIAAMSNDNSTVIAADHEPLIATVSCNPDGTQWASSAQGELVDIAAIASGPTINPLGTATTVGTANSYSVGPVAGCVAMMFSLRPDLTPADIRTILQATCVDLGTAGRDIYSGWGRINATAAIEMAKTFV